MTSSPSLDKYLDKLDLKRLEEDRISIDMEGWGEDTPNKWHKRRVLPPRRLS
jgi:hypothetical protein